MAQALRFRRSGGGFKDTGDSLVIREKLALVLVSATVRARIRSLEEKADAIRL